MIIDLNMNYSMTFSLINRGSCRYIFSTDYAKQTHIRKLGKDGETIYSLYYEFVATNTKVIVHGGEASMVIFGRQVDKSQFVIMFIDQASGAVKYIYTNPFIIIGEPSNYIHTFSDVDDDTYYFNSYHAAADRHYIAKMDWTAIPHSNPMDPMYAIRFNLTQIQPYVREVVAIDADKFFLSMLLNDTTNYIQMRVIDSTTSTDDWSSQILCTETYCEDYYFNIKSVLLDTDAKVLVHFTKTAGSIEVYNLQVADGTFNNHYTLAVTDYAVTLQTVSYKNDTAVNVLAYDSSASTYVIIVYEITAPTMEFAYYMPTKFSLSYYGTLENDQIQFFIGSVTEDDGTGYAFYFAWTETESHIYEEAFITTEVIISDDDTTMFDYNAFTPDAVDNITVVYNITEIGDVNNDVRNLRIGEVITDPVDSNTSYILQIIEATGDVTANLGDECTNGTYTIANIRSYPQVDTDYFPYTYELDISAELDGGSALPSWMELEATTGIITYTLSIAGTYAMNITINYITPENTITTNAMVSLTFQVVADPCDRSALDPAAATEENDLYDGPPVFESIWPVGIIAVAVFILVIVGCILCCYCKYHP